MVCMVEAGKGERKKKKKTDSKRGREKHIFNSEILGGAVG